MKMKHKFELMAIISGGISDAEIKKAVSGIKDLLGDEIVYEETWGMRDLAYQIKNQEKGYYMVWNFMADDELVKGLQHPLGLFPNLLRHLLLKVPMDYKPITLGEVEQGLEALKEQKISKRGKVKNATEKRVEEDKKPQEPVQESAPAQKAPAPVEKPSKEESAKTAKSLDEKLDAILSGEEDLGL